MFKTPFSFTGRIRRLEYVISYLIYFGLFILGVFAFENIEKGNFMYTFLLIIIQWFILAQGAKRCHDVGTSGFFQFIPFYGIWMLFGAGNEWDNRYGANPKVATNENVKKESFRIILPEGNTYIAILNQLMTVVLLNTLIVSICLNYLKQYEWAMYFFSLSSIICCYFLALRITNKGYGFSSMRLFLFLQRIVYSILLYICLRLYAMAFINFEFDWLLFYELFYVIIILATTHVSCVLYGVSFKKGDI